MIQNVYSYSHELPSFLLDCSEIEFSRHTFEKILSVNFHANPSSGSRLLGADRRTDRHNEANFANAPKNGSNS